MRRFLSPGTRLAVILLLTVTFQGSWEWAVFSPFVYLWLAQKLGEYRSDLRQRRAKARRAADNQTTATGASPDRAIPAAGTEPRRPPLSLAAVSAERTQRVRSAATTPAALSAAELAFGVVLISASTAAYLYASDFVPAVIAALAALGIGYTSGRVRQLRREEVVTNDDWRWLSYAAMAVFALGLAELYLLLHPVFGGDRIDALIAAFRAGGPTQVGELGGVSGWLVVVFQAAGVTLLLLAFIGEFRLLVGLCVRADLHAGILPGTPGRLLLAWEKRRGQNPWNELFWVAVVALVALALTSGVYFEAVRRELNLQPRLSQLTVGLAAGKVRVRFGLDRPVPVRFTLRPAGTQRALRSFVRPGRAGINLATFGGGAGAGGTSLRPGRYVVRLTAAGPTESGAGMSSKSVVLVVPG